MDYRDKYINLKKKIMTENDQHGSGKMNPLFLNELSKLVFVVDDKVLGDEIHAIICSLIEEFNRIASIKLNHNLEISQYHAVEKGLASKNGINTCQNCEIVLKYFDLTVCVSNGKVYGENFNKENDKYYYTGNPNEKIECTVSRGLVRFYIRQKIGETYKYTRILVVKLVDETHSELYTEMLYLDTDELEKIHEITSIAVNKAQSDIISKKAEAGQLSVSTPEKIESTVKTINEIIAETKKQSITPQLNKISSKKVLSNKPSQAAVDAANTVSKLANQTDSAKSNNMTTVMVPGNQPIPIQTNTQVSPVSGIITGGGTIIEYLDNGNGKNKLAQISPNLRAVIPVDANIRVAPAQKFATEQNVIITEPSNKSTTSLTNVLAGFSQSAKNVISNIGQTAKTVSTNIIDMVTGQPNVQTIESTKKTTTITPVSQTLSVQRKPDNDQIPVPQNETEKNDTGNQTVSYKTTTTRLGKKIETNNKNTTLAMNNSRALDTAKNGTISTRRTQEMTQNYYDNPTIQNSSLQKAGTRGTFLKTDMSDINLTDVNAKYIAQQTVAAPGSKFMVDKNRYRNIFY